MKLLYPCKSMNISQTYQGNFSHEPNRNGTPNDYPIDEAGADKGRDYFFAPCDLKVVKIYGVGTSGANTIWLESSAEVEMPCGKGIVTIMVVHPEDDDLKLLKVGQTFKQGAKMFREGMDGRATGNHFHMSVATGRSRGNGWVKNSRDAWVIFATGTAIKPEEAFFLPEGIKVINTGGLFFKPAGESEDEMRYDNLTEVPTFAKPTIKKLMDKGIVKGNSGGKLDLSDDMIRILVMNDRAGLYN